jgi:hypothetical protein
LGAWKAVLLLRHVIATPTLRFMFTPAIRPAAPGGGVRPSGAQNKNMIRDLGQPIAYGRTAEIYAWHPGQVRLWLF